jgi:hypothetical protein
MGNGVLGPHDLVQVLLGVVERGVGHDRLRHGLEGAELDSGALWVLLGWPAWHAFVRPVPFWPDGQHCRISARRAQIPGILTNLIPFARLALQFEVNFARAVIAVEDGDVGHDAGVIAILH